MCGGRKITFLLSLKIDIFIKGTLFYTIGFKPFNTKMYNFKLFIKVTNIDLKFLINISN